MSDEELSVDAQIARAKNERYRPLPLWGMSREQKIEELYECLTRLWSGGGELGVYTVANERDRLKALLADLL